MTLHRVNYSLSGHAPIIVAGLDLFDYSRGEPDERYLTILRAVEISHEYVKRVLVNQARIERTMLFRERAEADAVLQAQPGGGVAVTQDGFVVTRYRDTGGLTNPLQELPRNDRRHLMFTNRDSAAQILHLRQSEQDAERVYSEAIARVEHLSLNFKRVDRELKDAQVSVYIRSWSLRTDISGRLLRSTLSRKLQRLGADVTNFSKKLKTMYLLMWPVWTRC